MRQLSKPLLLLLLIIVLGTAGYVWLEHWSFLDSLYQMVITLSTVGFREVAPLSPVGRAFTIAIIIFGIAAVTYLGRRIIEFAIEGEMAGIRRHRKMTNTIKKIKEHYIVCGYGRVGRWVAHEFQREAIPFVVIDDNPDLERRMLEDGVLCIIGDASSDDVLHEAGVTRALGLVAVTDTDAENVFIAMSARALNPAIRVVSRADDERAEAKLLRAGVEGVIRPLQIAGTRIAHMLLHPATTGFLDIVTHSGVDELRIQDLPIGEKSPLAGLTIMGADIRARSGAMVLGICREPGTSHLNPPPDTLINPGDRLVVLGTRAQLAILEDIV
ncbi:MAG: potassium channel protein [Candidatus Eisenbacteria sp.]|nr:potassium channel protein [Candidatus Eisenbacteria bacterium]